jgi:ADP-ribose pyrophosphatase YjhB (NUDIX family)
VEIPPIISVSAIVDKQGKLLLLDHSYIKGYGLPGGIVKAGEDIETALYREVKEETGLDIISQTYFTSTASFHKSLPLISVTFMVKTSGIEKESSEGKLLWMSPDEALGKMAYSGVNTILQKYIQRRSGL